MRRPSSHRTTDSMHSKRRRRRAAAMLTTTITPNSRRHFERLIALHMSQCRVPHSTMPRDWWALIDIRPFTHVPLTSDDFCRRCWSAVCADRVDMNVKQVPRAEDSVRSTAARSSPPASYHQATTVPGSTAWHRRAASTPFATTADAFRSKPTGGHCARIDSTPEKRPATATRPTDIKLYIRNRSSLTLLT